MGASAVRVSMRLVVGIQQNQMSLTMAHALEGNQLVGNGANFLHRAAKHCRLDAVMMVKVCAHGAHHQIVVLMLEVEDTGCHGLFVLVVHIADIGDTPLWLRTY